MFFYLFLHLLFQLLFLLPNLLQLLVPGLTQTLPAIIFILYIVAVGNYRHNITDFLIILLLCEAFSSVLLFQRSVWKFY